MDYLVTGLTLGLVPGLGLSDGGDRGLRGWILSGTFRPELEASGSLILKDVALSQIAPYWSFDYERFALSCFETKQVHREEFDKFGVVSWPMLKAYYAAFFGAHSILRSQGLGITQLGKEPIDYLTSVLEAYGFPAQALKGGSFSTRIVFPDAGSNSCEVILSPAPSGKGVHESFWIYFSQSLKLLSESAVERLMPDSANFLAEADELVSCVSEASDGSSAWLSAIRNEINYQHLYETWLPMRKAAASIVAMGSVPTVGSFPLFNGKRKDPLKTFHTTNLFLSLLATKVADSVAQGTKGGRSFGSKWQRLRTKFE